MGDVTKAEMCVGFLIYSCAIGVCCDAVDPANNEAANLETQPDSGHHA